MSICALGDEKKKPNEHGGGGDDGCDLVFHLTSLRSIPVKSKPYGLSMAAIRREGDGGGFK